MLCMATADIVQVQTKISTLRSVFPDYPSVSYDYGFRVYSKMVQGKLIKTKSW